MSPDTAKTKKDQRATRKSTAAAPTRSSATTSLPERFRVEGDSLVLDGVSIGPRHAAFLDALVDSGGVARLGIALANWSEKWFPDPLIFAFLGIVAVAGAATRGD